MKKSITIIALALSLTALGQTGPTFTVNNQTGTYTTNCQTPSVSLSVASNYTGSLNYSWQGPNTALTGISVVLTTPGVYTVTAYNAQNVSTSQTFTVYSNFVNSAITPTIQNMACSPGGNVVNSVTLQAVNMVNALHTIICPSGASLSISGLTVTYLPGAPGTYTHILQDGAGCTTTKQFIVSSNQQFPDFKLASPQNFSLGCGSKSIAAVNVVSLTSQGSPSYTFLPPGFTGSYGFGIFSGTSATVAGIYTVVVRDGVNNCQTQIPFTVTQNTTAPVMNLAMYTSTLTCASPQTTLTCATGGVTYNWTFPSKPGPGWNTITTSTVIVGADFADPAGIVVNQYSLTLTAFNECRSSTVVTIYQNIKKPVVTGGTFTCPNPTTAIYATVTGAASYSCAWTAPAGAAVIGLTSSTLVTSNPGQYTVNVTDSGNGCSSLATVSVNTCDFTGITEGSSDFDISIYPNPSSGVFTVKTETTGLKVRVYTIAGTLITEREVGEIDIQNVPAGVYFIQIMDAGHPVYSSKLVRL